MEFGFDMNSYDIIYNKFLDDDHKTITKGGIQTYISDLCDLITNENGRVRIVQFSDVDFTYNLSDNVKVVGFKINCNKNSKRFQKLYDAAVLSREEKDVITIFATDTMIPKNVNGICIAIQHGIHWDIPKDTNRRLLRQIVSKVRLAYNIIKGLEKVRKVVCVDYNFLNWYRTHVDRVLDNIIVIPNYTRIAELYEKPCDSVNIIFARRLFDYRGTRVFTIAVKRLLDEKENVTVTIAGDGPDEKWMRQQLESYPNVSFIQYEKQNSLEIHKDKHIAVVPTVGSEGTSLSLLEAMSAQCAVVCTNVGGITNIVLNNYNGKIVNAGDVDQLYQAIKELIDNPESRERLAKTGYETVKYAFSYERWVNQWSEVIKNI